MPRALQRNSSCVKSDLWTRSENISGNTALLFINRKQETAEVTGLHRVELLQYILQWNNFLLPLEIFPVTLVWLLLNTINNKMTSHVTQETTEKWIKRSFQSWRRDNRLYRLASVWPAAKNKAESKPVPKLKNRLSILTWRLLVNQDTHCLIQTWTNWSCLG